MRLFEKRKNPRPPSRHSGVAALVLLLLLPAILGAVVWKGRRFDASLYYHEVQGRANVIPGDILDGVPETGLVPEGEPETFTKVNLYEKINGSQPAYDAYGFVELFVRAFFYGDGRESGEIFVYDMGAPENAFGIYSQEKPAEAEFLKLGTEGYRVGASVMFAADKYYVKVVCADESTEAAEMSLAAARAVLAKIPQTGGASGFDFPEENLKPDSLQYIKDDAFGLSFLSGVRVAVYTFGDKETTAYYTRDGDPMQIYAAYLAGAREMGEVRSETVLLGGKLAVLDIFGATEMILAAPGVFCGLQSVSDLEQGKALLVSLAERAAPKGGKE
ncbi:hypothetical protein HS125_12690 [bacterium]|nr:hypothetical protein [bacterium]